jgi:hypothetical protein
LLQGRTEIQIKQEDMQSIPGYLSVMQLLGIPGAGTSRKGLFAAIVALSGMPSRVE